MATSPDKGTQHSPGQQVYVPAIVQVDEPEDLKRAENFIAREKAAGLVDHQGHVVPLEKREDGSS